MWNLILEWVLFLWFFNFSEQITPPASPPAPHPPNVKILTSIVEKKIPSLAKIFYINRRKKIYENYIEFCFRLGTVLVIFSFFWTVNDLGSAPPPPEWYPPLLWHHNYAHTEAHSSKINWQDFHETLGHCSKQYKIN